MGIRDGVELETQADYQRALSGSYQVFLAGGALCEQDVLPSRR